MEEAKENWLNIDTTGRIAFFRITGTYVTFGENAILVRKLTGVTLRTFDEIEYIIMHDKMFYSYVTDLLRKGQRVTVVKYLSA